ncbi:unnamed protein product [Rhizoctonia solani]|uniref:Uncharacterized protein n=1 Tax=Rhizoctonia solani TaxID=456999 RepID=A0A8H3BP96_9AGAM|nr:unnamed protein product [Rhizoctonia solani]
MRLDYVLTKDFLGRGLQALVFKSGLAKLIHHARVLIRQRHSHIDCALISPYHEGRKEHVRRKHAAAADTDAGGDEEDEE